MENNLSLFNMDFFELWTPSTPTACSAVSPPRPTERGGHVAGAAGVDLVVEWADRHQGAFKVGLAAVSFVLAASMGGGFLLLPFLVPLHLWAARRSGPVGRAGWLLLPALGIGMVVWAGLYVAVGEAKPAIWLVPAVAAAVALAGLLAVTTPAHDR